MGGTTPTHPLIVLSARLPTGRRSFLILPGRHPPVAAPDPRGPPARRRRDAPRPLPLIDVVAAVAEAAEREGDTGLVAFWWGTDDELETLDNEFESRWYGVAPIP